MNLLFKHFRFYLQLLIAAIIFFPEMEAQNTTCINNNFGTIQVLPDVELMGAGQNIDTIEFWKAPDITESLMFVTSKDASVVEVWKYPFGTTDEQTPLTHTTLEPDNAEVNGIQVDQDTDLLYISVGSPNSFVCVFTLPDLEFVKNFGSSSNSYHSEPNLTLLNLTNGDKNLYVSADNIVYIHDVSDASSQNFGDLLSSFSPIQGLETMQADDFYQNLIIPDEHNTTGIYAYHPDGTHYPSAGQNNFGTNTIQGDGEGILIYNCSTGSSDQGDGFIVVSDQLTPLTQYEFYDRETWEYFGNMKVTGVSNTDGVASFPYFIPNYPMGVFAAINNDATTVLVSWEKIFNEIDANGGLPVELTSFSASFSNRAILLNWETATEVNNYGFEVERQVVSRSAPGGALGNWENIGFVEGNGSSNSPKYYLFTDDQIFHSYYNYRLKQIDNDGTFEYSNEIEVFVKIIPSSIVLEQNYPNPFNPTASIQYAISNRQFVTINVYDVLGNKIATLVNEEKPGGVYEVEFDGNIRASGMYMYSLQTLDNIISKKMMLLK